MLICVKVLFLLFCVDFNCTLLPRINKELLLLLLLL